MLKRFFKKDFLLSLLTLAIPITIQSFIMQSLNMVDMLMVGQLGSDSIAGVGIANQIYFIMSFILMGIGGGAAIFTSQYWGKGRKDKISDVLAISLKIALIISLIFTIIALIIPHLYINLYTKDTNVIPLSIKYIKIVGISFIFTAITFNYSAILRSIGNVRLPLIASIIALSTNTILNYILIFGKLGFPKMGVEGIALATTIARVLECFILIASIYLTKNPLAVSLKKLISIDKKLIYKYIKTTSPMLMGTMQWTIGIAIYNMIFSRIGTDSIAAINIAGTVEGIAFVIFIGISSAANIMIGQSIGAEKDGVAYSYGLRFIILGLGLAFIIGSLIYLSSCFVLSFYKISESTYFYAKAILNIMSFVLWLKISNMIMIMGIFTGGGDTKFSFYQGLIGMWLIGVPLALFGAFILKLPVYWIFLMIISEEVFKFFVCLYRFKSKKWIHNVTKN